MTAPLQWGIIGCGDVTEVKSGPAFNKVEGSRLHAVMRRNGDRARDYAERHGVPKWYDNAEALIHDPEVHAIYVATPPSSHVDYTKEALKAGKPVYVEKPMATTVEACQRMADAAAASGTKLTIAHYRRALPKFRKIRELIEQKEIGAVRTVRISLLQAHREGTPESNWRIDSEIGGEGGLFYDLAPHQLDILLWIFGDAQTAFGISTNQLGLYASRDIVSGIARFDHNIVFTGTWCFSLENDQQEDICEIVGTKGKICFSFFSNFLSVEKNGKTLPIIINTPQHIQQPMIEQVVRYFKDGGENPCSAAEAICSMRIMEKFIR